MRANGYNRWPYRRVRADVRRSTSLSTQAVVRRRNRPVAAKTSKVVYQAEQSSVVDHRNDSKLHQQTTSPILALAMACAAAAREEHDNNTSDTSSSASRTTVTSLSSSDEPETHSTTNASPVNVQYVSVAPNGRAHRNVLKLCSFIADAAELGYVLFIIRRPGGTLRMYGCFDSEVTVTRRSDGSSYISGVCADRSLAACIDMTQIAYVDLIDTVYRGRFANLLQELGEASGNVQIVRLLAADLSVHVAAVVLNNRSTGAFQRLREKYGTLFGVGNHEM